MTWHESSVGVHDLDKLVLALDVQPLHCGPVSNLAFLQFLQHIRERASFETFVHRPKLLLNQVERTFFVNPTFSKGTNGVLRVALIFSINSNASGSNPSR
jgi:hypothetical protein